MRIKALLQQQPGEQARTQALSQRDEFFNTYTATADDDKIKEGDQRRHPTPNTQPQSLAPTKAHAQAPPEKARTAPPSHPHPGIFPKEDVPPGTEAAAPTGRERDRPHGDGRRQSKASCDTGSLTSNTRNASAQAQACFTFHTPQYTWGIHAGLSPSHEILPVAASAPPVLSGGLAPGTSLGWNPARSPLLHPLPPVPTPQGQTPPLQESPQTLLLQ